MWPTGGGPCKVAVLHLLGVLLHTPTHSLELCPSLIMVMKRAMSRKSAHFLKWSWLLCISKAVQMIVCTLDTFRPQVLIASLDQQLPHNDDEGRVLLEEGDVSTQIPVDIKPKRIRYCGVKWVHRTNLASTQDLSVIFSCILFWKALGIVLLGFALWFGYKFFRAPIVRLAIPISIFSRSHFVL